MTKQPRMNIFVFSGQDAPPPAHFSMRETRIITTNNVCLTAVSLPHLDNKVSFIAPSYQLTDT